MLKGKGKLISQFTPVSSRADAPVPDIKKSGHEVTLVYKPRKDTRWFFKKYSPEQVKLAEYEAAFSAFYQLMLNNRAAKIRVVYSDETKREIVGAVSKEIPGLIPLNKALTLHTLEELIDSGLAQAILTSSINEEDDLHDGNLGFANGTGICRLDYDMSRYPITSKIKGKRIVQGTIYPLPEKAFPVTPSIIKDITNSAEISAYHWPRKKEFSSLKDNPRFLYNEYRALLKYILLDTDIFPLLFKPFLSNEEDLQNLSSHEKLCHEKYSGVLINMPEFREAVFQNPEYIIEILAEFEEYNTNIRGKNEIVIDLEKIKENYRSVFKSCIKYQFMYLLISFEKFSLSLEKEFIEQITEMIVIHYADKHLTPSEDSDFAIRLRHKIEIFKSTLEDKFSEDIKSKIIEHCNAIDSLLGYIRPHSTKYPEVTNLIYNLSQKKTKIDALELSRRMLAAQTKQERPVSRPRQQFTLQNIADELYMWANNPESKEYIIKAIQTANSEYNANKWFASWRNDPHKIKQASDLKNIIENPEVNISTIFNKFLETLRNGSWGPQSFNTLLIVNLIIQFSNYKNKDLTALELADFLSDRDYLLFYQQAPSSKIMISGEEKQLYDIAQNFHTLMVAGRPVASASLTR